MKTVDIKYSKKITVIETESNGDSKVYTVKASELKALVSSLECFNITFPNTVKKKIMTVLSSCGFDVSEYEGWGFEWESKVFATV